MRRPVRRLLVDMAANAEAELGILEQHLARLAILRPQMLVDEVLVEQDLGDEFHDSLLAADAGICLQGGADVSAQLLEGISHWFLRWTRWQKSSSAGGLVSHHAVHGMSHEKETLPCSNLARSLP